MDIDKEMDIDQRDEEIWRMRREGVPLSQIATRFELSSTRVQQIYNQRQKRLEDFHKWPPLKRMLPARVQNILTGVFGSEEIFCSPGKLASLGPEVFYKWRNMGRKGVKQLVDALESLGFCVSENVTMAHPQNLIFLKIGRAILREYFEYYVENSLDDAEYIPTVRVIIEGMAKGMESYGMGRPYSHELAEKLKGFNRQLCQNLWVKQAKGDESQANGEKESEEAKKIFDYIYKYGKDPR